MKEKKTGRPKGETRVRRTIWILPDASANLDAIAVIPGSLGRGVELLLNLGMPIVRKGKADAEEAMSKLRAHSKRNRRSK